MKPKQPPTTLWDELERLEDGNPPRGFSSEFFSEMAGGPPGGAISFGPSCPYLGPPEQFSN